MSDNGNLANGVQEEQGENGLQVQFNHPPDAPYEVEIEVRTLQMCYVCIHLFLADDHYLAGNCG